MAFSLPYASDFEKLSAGILNLVAKVAQVDSKWVSLAKMSTSAPQNRRRLLAEMVYTTYNVQPPRGETANPRTADQIASSLTSSNIDQALQEDPALSQYITGFTVTKVSVDSVAEESIFTNVEILIAVISGSIGLLACCCMALACIGCIIRKKRQRAMNSNAVFEPLQPEGASSSFPHNQRQQVGSTLNEFTMPSEMNLLFPVSLANPVPSHTPRPISYDTRRANESVFTGVLPVAPSHSAAPRKITKGYIDVKMDKSDFFSA